MIKPIVRESEKSRILMTKDYDLFDVPNYVISRKFLAEITESISKKNLCKNYPILVDANYRIIDGRYKFIASKNLKAPIWYKVAEGMDAKDAIRVKAICKRADFVVVSKIYSDIEQYNALLLLGEIFPDVPFKLLIKATQTCDKTYGQRQVSTIDVKRYQAGEMGAFDFSETSRRLNITRDVFHWFSTKIDRFSWFDAYYISDTYGFDSSELEARKAFVFSCRKIPARTFKDAFALGLESLKGHRLLSGGLTFKSPFLSEMGIRIKK